jgi:hypothetical protein
MHRIIKWPPFPFFYSIFDPEIELPTANHSISGSDMLQPLEYRRPFEIKTKSYDPDTKHLVQFSNGQQPSCFDHFIALK